MQSRQTDIMKEFCFSRDAHHTDMKINLLCFLDNCNISALIKH